MKKKRENEGKNGERESRRKEKKREKNKGNCGEVQPVKMKTKKKFLKIVYIYTQLSTCPYQNI